MKKFKYSIQLGIQDFKGKQFKVLACMIRSGVYNEHGFLATKGMTDSRLEEWSIVIRFATQKNKERFEESLQLLHPQVLKEMRIKDLNPSVRVVKPIRWAN
ncbi:MAG: hypothetical protein Q8Q54_16225 [Methylococcales bacterium]|nr:hypothetical protein [Methylococcales bacterium]MDP3840465.1 hypothetical protein [Methylococcales bacterium]